MTLRAAKRKAPRPQRVELQFLESVRRRLPAHERTLEALGHLYTRTGRFVDGLQVDEALTRLRPADPMAWYNLACSQSLTGDLAGAFAALRKAIDLGYADVDWLLRDEDLAALRGDERFAELLKQLARRMST